MKSLLAVILLLCAVPWAGAQDYPHHNFTFGAGAGRPRGDLGPVLEDSPGVAAGYGYRFIRYFQADLGLDVLSARVRDFLTTQIGDFRIRDREYLLMLGGSRNRSAGARPRAVLRRRRRSVLSRRLPDLHQSQRLGLLRPDESELLPRSVPAFPSRRDLALSAGTY
jgi:hypothetical protein